MGSQKVGHNCATFTFKIKMKKAKEISHTQESALQLSSNRKFEAGKKRNHKAQSTPVFQQLLSLLLSLRDRGPKYNLGHVWMKSPTQSQWFSKYSTRQNSLEVLLKQIGPPPPHSLPNFRVSNSGG